MMMVPEAWENQADHRSGAASFYEYHSMLMEPWDGPAAIVFTDGSLVGATLDRNGLRPGRYRDHRRRPRRARQRDRRARLRPGTHRAQGPPAPGKMFLVDTDAGRIIEDDEIKAALAAAKPGTSGSTPAASTSPTCRSASTSCTRRPPSCAASAPSATPRKKCASCSPRWRDRRRAARRDGHRHARSPCSPSARGCSSTTSPAVRPGDEPAARLDPRRGRHLARARPRPGAQPALAPARSTPARSPSTSR